MLEGRCSNNYRRSHIDSNATSTNPWIGQRQHPHGAPTSNARHAQREVRSSNCFDHPDRTDRTPGDHHHPNGTRRKDRNPADETSSTPKLRCQLTKVCAQTPGVTKEKHAMAAKRTDALFNARFGPVHCGHANDDRVQAIRLKTHTRVSLWPESRRSTYG